MDMVVENGNKFQVKDPMCALTHFIGLNGVVIGTGLALLLLSYLPLFLLGDILV